MNTHQTFSVEYKSSANALAAAANLSINENGFTLKIAQPLQTINFNFIEIAGIHRYNEKNVVVNFGAYPYQSFTCRDEAFLDFLKAHYKKEPLVAALFKNGKSTFVKYILILTSLIIGLIVLAYFFLLPFLVNKAVEHFPQEYEYKFGKAMFNQVQQSEKIDAYKTTLLNQLFDSLHFAGTNKVELLCVKKKEVNAYALPGGFIVVYDEIINKMQTSHELAGLLAHEYAHIKLKHTLKNAFNTVGFSLLVQIIFGGFDDSLLTMIGTQTEQLRELQYSRSLEKDADENGFTLMQKKQLDPNGMINLFERLNAESNVKIPSILSTHPLPEERINFIQKLIQENKYQVKNNNGLEVIFVQMKDKNENSY